MANKHKWTLNFIDSQDEFIITNAEFGHIPSAREVYDLLENRFGIRVEIEQEY